MFQTKKNRLWRRGMMPLLKRSRKHCRDNLLEHPPLNFPNRGFRVSNLRR
jgi:hypothetical protein